MSKTETKKLKSDRKQVVSQILRFEEFLNGCDENTSQIAIQARFSKCEYLWEEFNKIQLELEFNNDEETRHRIEFENKYFEVICRFNEILTPKLVNADSLVPRPGQQNALGEIVSNVRLPPIDLPSFSGNYENWLGFFDTFSALIHCNKSLSDVQKFYYLQSAVKGEAAQLIKSIEVNEQNYQIAWNLLREQFENKRLIIQNHLKSLFELFPINKESHSALKKLVNTVQINIRALTSLGEPVDQWDTVLIYLISSKLDSTSKREWESHCIQKKELKFKDFIKFLQERCELLERLEINKYNTSGSKNYSTDSSKFRNYQKQQQTSHSLVSTQKHCALCNDSHSLFQCQRFLDLSEVNRVNEIKKLQLCLNCFKPDHFSTSCAWRGCKKCGKPHNTLLHIDFSKNNRDNHCQNFQNNNTKAKQPEQATNTNNSSSEVLPQENKTSSHIGLCNNASGSNSISSPKNNSNENTMYDSDHIFTAHGANKIENEVLLSTAKVLVRDEVGKSYEARVLLDGGSQSNFVTENFCKKLNLVQKDIRLSIVGINSSITNSKKVTNITIESKYNSFSTELQFFVLNRITDNLPTFSVDRKSLHIPPDIYLADDTFDISGPIDMLLGASIFYELLGTQQIKISKNAPILQETILGWIIAGNIPKQSQKISKVKTVCNLSTLSIQDQLESFWRLEHEIQTSKIMKKEEKDCEELFKKTTAHASDGRFIVELPVKEEIEDLGESKETAIKRFYALERRLSENEELRQQYSGFMEEYEALEHMTKISEDELKIQVNPVYYLPHHPVIRETSSTTRLRVVFDASAKTSKGISLNDVLKTGPNIQDDLVEILLRFRKHTVVFGADVEKMYRQVWIKSEQRNLQRIIWRKNPDEEIHHYKLNTVTYGTAPASFLAIRSLQQTAVENEHMYPEAHRIIMKDFYVDDLLSGANTIEEARKLKMELTKVLRRSGFILRKWISNDKNIFEPADSSKSEEIKHYVMNETMAKTLGLIWNVETDSLQYTVKFEMNAKVTKRSILSIISKIFDPLGLIGPLTIKAKVILQKLWLEKLDWDDEVSRELLELWEQFYNELPLLNNLIIPRHAICEKPIIVDLHGYCDASEKSYGCCIYLRSVNSNGEIYTTLLCAKSKVAPIKTITLPRLELCGALLLAKLMTKAIESLDTSIRNSYYWTDSTIVLSWLAEEPSNWKIFVAHRVAEIQQLTKISNWRHVSSEDNPADLISRGCTPEKLLNCDLWWNGPLWLKQSQDFWPNYDRGSFKSINNDNELEKRKTKQVFVATFQQDIFTRYSTFLKLQRILAFCLRFCNNLRNKNNKLTGCLTTEELDQALIYLVRVAQVQEFSREISALKLNKPIPPNSKLISLNPFLDINDILRVGGRLKNSLISYEQKHPILLSNKHPLCKLVIMHEHKKNLHAGPQLLLSILRSRFWILSGMNTVKGILRNCIVCFKNHPKNISVIMGQLPSARVTPARPFLNSGVDYAGPFNLRTSRLRNSKIVKAYLCLFVCFSTKAIHIEVVSDLTTEAFLNSLKRFISRRGKCKNLYSDNGTNFVGAKNELIDLFALINSQEHNSKISEYLSIDSINWNFIPPRSPHFGGLWEANVKLVKYHLKRVLGNEILTFEELVTVVTQIESCINSRPLTPLSNDPHDLSPLTPGHFLIGDAFTAPPQENIKEINTNHLTKYQHLTQLLQHFWNRWSKEYLSNLNQRTKWKYNNCPKLKIGDLVVLKEENLPPLKWSMGRIEALHPGTDGAVRVVSVKTAKGVFRRAIAKICVLPLDEPH